MLLRPRAWANISFISSESRHLVTGWSRRSVCSIPLLCLCVRLRNGFPCFSKMLLFQFMDCVRNVFADVPTQGSGDVPVSLDCLTGSGKSQGKGGQDQGHGRGAQVRASMCVFLKRQPHHVWQTRCRPLTSSTLRESICYFKPLLLVVICYSSNRTLCSYPRTYPKLEYDILYIYILK